jgi:signal transduction histidine kinase
MTALTPDAAAPRLDASQRQLMRRAATVGLLMRNCVNLVVGLVSLADPDSLVRPAGRWLLVAVALWSLFRLLTRSHGNALLAVDYVLVLAVCAAIPILIPDPHFYSFNTAPQAIAGTAVISFSVAVSPRASLPMALGVAGAYAWGAATVLGWGHLGAVAALYYFALQWGTASLIRAMLLRVAGAVDRARSDRHAAELNKQVTEAVRDYEREQLALLHDTAASTLLMVGQGTSLPPQRLSVQARRDLDLLDEGPWVAPPRRVELVDALRNCSAHLSTPTEFAGREQVWLGGETARSVISAAREAMNNVDRHARASRLRVTVSTHAVVLEDDGIGFDPDDPRTGHGVTDSILGRMSRAGGYATISSKSGAGTMTELVWAATPADSPTPAAVDDPDRLIERVRARYGLALTAYALANLAFAVPHAVITKGTAAIDATLGTVAAISTVAALPGILRDRWRPAWFAGAALLLVSIAQPALLSSDLVGGYSHWAQNSIGWCVLPLVLGLSTRTAATVLGVYWIVGASVELARHPSAGVLVNIGLGTASILGVQLFALVFNGLMRDAAADVQADTRAHQRLISRDRVAQALRAEYQRRYAQLVDDVVPLLRTLSSNGVVDDDLRRRASAECRRLRALFDQAATFDHPLMQRLRPVIDAAEERHVDLAIDVAGDLPELTADEIDAVVRPLAGILDASATSARIVLTSTAEEMTVSVVCDGSAAVSTVSGQMNAGGGDQIEIVPSDDMVWCLIRHELRPDAEEHALA